MAQTLEKQIEFILSLKDDWDGEGSPGYKRETIDRALAYIPKFQERIRKERGAEVELKYRLCQGPNGSIDVEDDPPGKESKDYIFLLNVPSGTEAPTYFYNDSKGKLKGSLES